MIPRGGRYALLPLLLLFSSPAFAQRAFQVFLPELTPADKRPAVQTPDGGFCILTGYMELGTANRSFVLLKTTPDGTLEWQRKLSTKFLNDYPVALRRTADGGFFALGATSEVNSWDQDILLMRLNEHGYPIWSRTYDFSVTDWASDMVVLEDGSVVIVGSTQATDSASAHALIEQEGEDGNDESMAWMYDNYTAERTLAFRIDPEGEVVWGGWVKGGQRDSEEYSTHSFAQAVCIGQENSVALIEQTQWQNGLQFSTIVRVKGDGTPLSGMIMTMPDKGERFGSMLAANDLVSVSNGDVIVAGTTIYETLTREIATKGYLFRLDNANQVLWHKTYNVDGDNNPLPLTVAPMAENRFLIAGRTSFTGIVHTDYDNPVIGVVDAEGTPVEATQWITELNDLPFPRSDEYSQNAYLNWPLFMPTDDQGALSIGTVDVGSNDYGAQYKIGLLITRLNPDLTPCGDDESRTVPLTLNASPDNDTEIDYGYYNPRLPLDVIAQDLRRSSQPDIVNFDVVDIAMPEYAYNIDTVKTSDVSNIEYDGGYNEINIDSAPSRYEEDEGEYQDAPPPPTVDTVYSYDYYSGAESEEETEGTDATEYPLADTAYYDYSYEGNDQAASDTAYSYDSDYSDDDDEEYSATPRTEETIFFPIDIAIIPLDGTSRILPDVDAKDYEGSPWFVCQNAPSTASFATPDAAPIVQTEYLNLLPNSVQKGKSTTAEFKLSAQEKPAVELINVGLGQTVERIAEKEVLWKEGAGSATIQTSGLPAGVYLVRVRSGERQVTAKLEVR